MKRLKKLLIAMLSVVMLVSFGMFTAACDSCNETPGPQDTVTISIESKFADLELGVKGKLSAVIEGLDGATVVWSSSDSAVITISADGSYEALALGSSTITASIKEKPEVKDSMKVEVVKNTKGNLYVSEDNTLDPILAGGTFELTPFVLYGSEKIYDGLTFTYESSDESVFTVENGVITGVSVGDATLTISTVYRNDELSISVPVSIVSSAFISIEEKGTGLRNPIISTYAYQGIVTFTELEVIAFEDGVPVESAIFWSTSDDSVATVDENGKVYAVSEGTADITASFIASDGATYSDVITVTVQRPTIATGLKIDYLIGEKLVLPEFTEADFCVDNVVSVTYNGKEAFDSIEKVLDKDVVIGSANELRDLKVYTSSAIYEIQAKVTNAIIEDADDLKDLIFKLAYVKVQPTDDPVVDANTGAIKTSTITYNDKSLTYPIYPSGMYLDGYVEFAADVDFGGEAFSGIATASFKSQDPNKNNGFRGVIDGKGYTIYNMTLATEKGFIYQMGLGAVLKNLNFEDLLIEGQKNGIAIIMYDDTLVENVNAKATLGLDGSHSKYYAQGILGLVSGSAKIKNCEFWLLNKNVDVLDATAWVGVVGSLGDRPSSLYNGFFENVIVVAETNKLFVTYTNDAVVDDSQFNKTSILYCSNVGDYYVEVLGYTLSEEKSTFATCTEGGVNVYVKDGEEDFEMVVPAKGHDFTVSGDDYTCSCGVTAVKVSGLETDLDKGLTASIIAPSVEDGVEIVSAKYNRYDKQGAVVGQTNAGITDGKVSFATSDAVIEANRNKTYFVTLSNGEAYVVDFTVYSLLIQTEEDLMKMSSYQFQAPETADGLVRYGRYATFKLMNDITLTQEWLPAYQLGLTNSYATGFSGTFDGAGHTISGIRSTKTTGALFQSVQGATIKNVKFVVDGRLSRGGVLAGYASSGTDLNTLYENVTVEYNVIDNVEAQYGLMFGQLAYGADITLKNVKFIYNGEPMSVAGRNAIMANSVPEVNYAGYGFAGTLVCDGVEIILNGLQAELFRGPYKKVISDESSTTKIKVPYALGQGFSGEIIVKANDTAEGKAITNVKLDAKDLTSPGQLEISSILTGEVAYSVYQYVEGSDPVFVTVIGNQFNLPVETGAYNYVIYTDTLSAYFITLNVTKQDMIELAPSNGDIKAGIDVGALFEGTAYESEVPVKLTIEDNFLEVNAEGIAMFSDIELAKKLPKAEAYSAFISTESGKIFTTELTLWSLIINNRDDFLEMQKYEYMEGVAGSASYTDGRYLFAKDIVIDMTGAKWNKDTQLASRVSGYMGAGFKGYIDGNGATIKNFETEQVANDADLADGGLIRSIISGAVVKNLTIEALSSTHGIIASRGTGFTFDNVTVELKSNKSSTEVGATDGLLVSYVFHDNDIVLKDVTFIYTGEGAIDSRRSALIGTSVQDTLVANYAYSGNVILDNVVVAGLEEAGINVFNGHRYTKVVEGEGEEAITTWFYSPFGLGNGAIKAENAEVALTVYKTVEDYNNGANACVVEYAEFAPADKVDANATFNLASVAGKGEKTLFAKLIKDTSYDVIAPMNGEIVTPSELGIYTYYVTTDSYNFYKITIETKALDTIELGAVTGDLKKLDVGSLFKGQYANYTPTTISFNEKAYPVENGIVKFDIKGANDGRALASNQVQEILIATEEGQYFIAEMTLWSLIIKTEDDLFNMYKYEYNQGGKTYGYFFVNNDVTVSAEWKANALGRTGATIGYDGTDKLVNSYTNAFNGYIDGNNKTLTFARMATDGCLIYNAGNATVKNLTIVQTTGIMGTGTIAQNVTGNATFENVKVVINGLFTYRGAGALIGHIVGNANLVLKDVDLTIAHNLGANANKYPLIANGYRNTSFSFGYSFCGSVTMDNVNIFGVANYGDMLFNGYVYEVTDAENNIANKYSLYYDDYFVTGDVTMYAGLDKVDGYQAKFVRIDNNITGVRQGGSYDTTKILGAGETVKEAYLVDYVSGEEIFNTSSTSKTIVVTEETLTVAGVLGNSITLPNEVGKFTYLVRTNLNGYYYFTVETEYFKQVTIEGEFKADLKGGIDAQAILNAEGINETAKEINVNGVNFTLTNGKLDFVLDEQTLGLPMVAEQSAVIATTSGSYTLESFVLYSLIIEDRDDFVEMQKYEYMKGVAGSAEYTDGRYIFAKDIVIDMEGAKWNKDTQLASRVSGFMGAGFKGIIDGNGATIKNFETEPVANDADLADGGLIRSATGAIVKNLTIEALSSTHGIIASRAYNFTIENVTVELKSNKSSTEVGATDGLLVSYVFYSSPIVLKDVTFIYSGEEAIDSRRSALIGTSVQETLIAGYGFRGEMILDNVVVVGLEKAGINVFNGYRYTKVGEGTEATYPKTPFGLGNGAVKAEGADVALTVYKTVEDYTNNTNACVVNYGEYNSTDKVYASGTYNPASVAGNGENTLFAKLVADGTYSEVVPTAGEIAIPSEVGTYTYYVTTDSYNFYKVTINAVQLEVVELGEITGDLKDGVDLTGLFTGEYAEEVVSTVTIGEQVFIAQDNKLTFEISGANDARALASNEPVVINIKTESGNYYSAELTLWSLILKTEQDVFDMVKYEYVVGSTTYGYYFVNNDISVEATWNTVNLGKTKATIGTAYDPAKIVSSYSQGFSGIIEGNGKTITFANKSTYGGLINNAKDSIVRNLNIVQTTGCFGEGILAYYSSSNALFENVTVTFNKAYTYPGNAALVGTAVYGSTTTFKNVSLFVNADFSAYSTKPVLVQAYNGTNFSFGYAFKGYVVMENVKVFNVSNYGDDMVKGSVYTLTDEENAIYSKVTLGLDNNVSGDITFYPGATEENGYTAKYSELDKVSDIPQGSAYDITSLLGEGETIRELYLVTSENKVETFNTTGTNESINVVEEIRSAYGFLDNSITLPDEVGEFTFFIRTNLNGYYKIVLGTKLFTTSAISGTYETDLRTGFDAAEILADNDINDMPVSVAIGGITFNADAQGFVKFTNEQGIISDAVKQLPDEEAQSITITTANGRYELADFTLVSLYVGSEEDLAAMKDYAGESKTVSGHTDGYFKLTASIDVTTGIPLADLLGQQTASGALYGGFMGTIDGCGFAINNMQVNGSGRLMRKSYKATVKNITLSTGLYNIDGVVALYAEGLTLDNVTIMVNKFNIYGASFKEVGLIASSPLWGSDINLTDVNIIYNGTNTEDRATGWLFGIRDNNSYRFYGNVICDNVNIVNTNMFKANLIVGPYGKTDNLSYASIGNGITGTITAYPTIADFENKTNGHQAQAVEEKTATVALNTAIDFNAVLFDVLEEGEIVYNVNKENGAAVYGASYNNNLTVVDGLAEEGSVTYIVNTNFYNVYKVTVNVRDLTPTALGAVAGDLRDGLDLSAVFTGEYASEVGKTLSIGEKNFSIVDNKVAFDIEGANDARALASEVAQTAVIETEAGNYYSVDLTLLSFVVKTADDLFIMNKYLYQDGSSFDGAIKFANDIDYSTRDTETYANWAKEYRLGNTVNNTASDTGFIGYIDGNNTTISNFMPNGIEGGLIANGTNYTIKNLNVVHSGAFSVNGALGHQVNGATLENVSLYTKHNWSTGTGVLFNVIRYSNDINLKNVTIKFDTTGDIYSAGWSILGAVADYSAGYYFTGKIYVDNVIVASGVDYQLVAKNYMSESNWSTNVLDYGDGIVKADGAEKGIIFYKSAAMNGTAYESEIVEKEVTAYTTEVFDFASVLGEGETFQYYKGNVATATAGYKFAHVEKAGLSTYQFTEVGTYKFAVRTTDFKYYILTITVSDEVRVNETVETAYEFDLRDGIDTSVLLDSEGNALTGVTGANFNGTGFAVSEGKVAFTDATTNNATKALAGKEVGTLVVNTENGTYTYPNITLWSLYVKTADDLFIINDYLSIDGDAVDGAIKFINDIDFATRDTETYSAWADQYRIGNAVGTSSNVTGFVGYIEGNGKTISNLNTSGKYGGLIANVTDATIKNLNVSHAAFAVTGTFGTSVNGANLENVSVYARWNSSTGFGVLFRELRYNKDINLKNVTIKFDTSNAIYSNQWGFFGAANDNGGYSFAGKIYVDNVIISSAFDLPLVGYTYTTDPLYKTDLLEYGSGIVKADGAEKGITFYRNATLTGTAYEATAVEKEVKAYTTEQFDFASVLGEGESFLYYKGNVAAGKEGRILEHIEKSGDSLYQFTEVGTYRIAVATTLYKYYLLTVTVSDEVRVDETIETAYAFDLKDGIDTTILLDNEGNALTGVTGVNVNGLGFSLTEGVASFGEVASMTDEVKLLASVEPRTVIVTAEKGTYTYTNVSIWSLFVNDLDELKSMYLYQTTARKGVFKLEADLELPIIKDTTTWDATWSLGAKSIVDAGFAGYFDGGNHTIYGISNRTAECNIFGNICGGTVKNLTLSQAVLDEASSVIDMNGNKVTYPATRFDLNGILARYVSGETLIENVTVDLSGFYTHGGRSPLIGNLARDAKVTLKDVNIFIDKSGLNNTADYYKYNHGIIASEFANDSYINGSGDKSSTSEVYVNNVNIIGINVVSKWRLFGGSYHEYVEGAFVNTPRELGNGVSLAEGASLGINIYADRENFTAGTATYTVTSTVLDDITLAQGESLSASTAYTKNSGTPVSITPSNFMMSDGTNFGGTNTVASTLTFSEVGTYFVIFRDASYNHYIANVKVVPVEEIATAYAFDLKDGIDTSVLKDAEGNALTGVTAISYAGNSYSLTEGKATFGDVAEMSDDTKMLASATARALVVTTENGKYSYPNVTLWSIIVDNEEELRLMRTYAKGTDSSAKTGYYYINSDITLTPVDESDPTVTWKTEWQLGSGVWQAFNGVIDGGNHTISNISNYGLTGGTIIGSANAATIKNINFEMQAGAASFGGLILEYSYSSTLLENVSLRVERAFNYSSGLGLIANRYTQGMTLRNVKVFLEDAGFNAAEGAIYRRGLLLGQFESSGYGVQSATNGVKVDNLEIIGMDSVKEWRLFGGNLTLNNKTEFTPWELGNGVVLADGATKGIVIYKTEEDYTNGISTEMTSTTLDAITITAGDAINAETTFTKGGDAVELTPATLAYGTAQFTGVYSYNGSLTFDTAGTFVVAIRDANYNIYFVTVTVNAKA